MTGVTARADVSGTGQLTANGSYWVSGTGWVPLGKSIDIEVKGTYQDNFKSLNIMNINMPDGKTSYTNPLILKLDPETGNVTGSNQVAYYYSNNKSYPAYYVDFTDDEKTAPHVITGKLENTGTNESTLTLSTWTDLLCNGNTNWYFNEGKWENTKIVFNFAIPDLPAYDETPQVPSPTVQPDPSVG